MAYAAPYFYVVGSHGCSRGKAKFKLSTFVLARIRVDANGEPAGPDAVETTYRLGDALGLAETVSAYYTQDLQTDDGDATPNGLNIEGSPSTGRGCSPGCARRPMTARPSSSRRMWALCSRRGTSRSRRPRR